MRLSQLDWPAIEESLWTQGYAVTPPLLTPQECATLVRLYAKTARFRKRVNMAQHRFGLGEYQYFANPLPRLVTRLRTQAYPPLARIANRWMAALKQPEPFPSNAGAFPSAAAGNTARSNQPPCCCITNRAATTVCIRICMGPSPFPCK